MPDEAAACTAAAFVQPSCIPAEETEQSSVYARKQALQARLNWAQDDYVAGSRSGGGDYFVPWHVPFHRVEAAAAASKVRTGEASHHQSSALVAMPHAPSASHQPAAGTDVAGGISAAPLAKAERMEGKQAEQEGSEQFSRGLNEAAQEHGGSSPCTESGVASSRPDVSKSFLDGRVDEAKRTVVFKRYYHLYDKGELEGLVEQVPNVKLVSSFFDKSNWCAMFEKV